MRPQLSISYPNELPIVERREEVARAIREHRVVIVCGETGSGKSTQLPKICLELGRGRDKMIGMTQPRRIAARSVAARLAEELGAPLGQQVGFQIRFVSQTSPQTYIKVMTDGILLAESQRDRHFARYDTLIIDEAHERSLNIDFLLGLARRALEARDDLKLIITSATLDAEKFAKHFALALPFHGKQTSREKLQSQATELLQPKIVRVEGRTFPIEIRYRDEEISKEEKEQNETDRLLVAVEECYRDGGGDILIFLPTERDIADASKAIKHFSLASDAEVLPLYARLPLSSQQKIFQKSRKRKIVLATNVAESSITVPNIRFVIDTGRARISRWSPDSKTQRLPIEPISQSSANQRAGRCGRVRDGICLRLYSEEDFSRRDQYTTPEIQRTHLAAVVLQALAMRLGRLENFPLIDPPSRRAINEGYKTLFEIGAIDKDEKLTPLGTTLAKLPLDPRLARVIVAAVDENCLAEMLVIVSAMEIQDPRERPPEFAAAADLAHSKFLDSQSDFVGYLRLWQFYLHLKETLSHSQLRKACAQNFLSANRMREWSDLHVQLMRVVENEGIAHTEARRTQRGLVSSLRASVPPCEEKKHRENQLQAQIAHHTQSRIGDVNKLTPQKYAAIHRAILTGFLSRVAQRERVGNSYTLCSGGTFRLWRGSGLVKQEKNYSWILAAESLETSQRFLRTVARIESHWVESLGQHLLRHTVSSPHWDAETGYVHAYEKVTLFSLVIIPKRRVNFGNIDPRAARDIFIQEALVPRNMLSDVPGDVLGNLGALAEKSDVISGHLLLLEEAKKTQNKLRRHDIVRGELFWHQFYHERLPQNVFDAVSLLRWEKTATSVELARLTLTLADILATECDNAALFPDVIETANGATIPLEYTFAPSEARDGITLVVPEAELKSLDAARLGWLVPGLLEQKIVTLLKGLPKSRRTKIVPIPDTAKKFAAQIDFAAGALEVSLARLVSRETGEAVSPRDFQNVEIPNALLANIKVVAADGATVAEGRDLGTLREELGLADEPVAPEIDARAAEISAFSEKHRRKLREQVKWLPLPKRYGLATFPEDDLIFLIAARALEINSTAESKNIALAAQELSSLIPSLAEKISQARLAITQSEKPFPDAARDAQTQLALLTAPNFLRTTPWRWLREFPRYLDAIIARFEKIRSGGINTDAGFIVEISALRNRYQALILASRKSGIDCAHLADFEWLLEEYRVSCFAQKLGTSVKVSGKRLMKMLEE